MHLNNISKHFYFAFKNSHGDVLQIFIKITFETLKMCKIK